MCCTTLNIQICKGESNFTFCAPHKMIKWKNWLPYSLNATSIKKKLVLCIWWSPVLTNRGTYSGDVKTLQVNDDFLQHTDPLLRCEVHLMMFTANVFCHLPHNKVNPKLSITNHSKPHIALPMKKGTIFIFFLIKLWLSTSSLTKWDLQPICNYHNWTYRHLHDLAIF